MTRLAVLSDIHGNLPALKAVLADIKSRGRPDAYWILGDLAAFCPWPSKTLARLRALPNASFLRGNTDRYLVTGRRPAAPVNSRKDWDHMPQTLKERDATFRWAVERLTYKDYEFLRDLPARLEDDVPGYGTITAVHATPEDDETFLRPDTPVEDLDTHFASLGARLILYGHTHQPMDHATNDFRLVNDGSVGLPLDGDPRPAYAMLDFGDGGCQVTIHRVPYDHEEVIKEMERLEHPGRSWIGGMIREVSA